MSITSAKFESDVQITDQRTVGVRSSVDVGAKSTSQFTATSGTGALQFNKVYQAVRTFASANEDLDMTALTDVDGASLSFSRVVYFRVVNRSSSQSVTVNTTISNGFTALFNGTAVLPAGATTTGTDASLFELRSASAAGFAVTAGTGDLIRLSGTVGQNVEVIICGS